jgi:hypothetical protein
MTWLRACADSARVEAHGEYAVFGLGKDGFAGLTGPEPGHDGDRRRDRDPETRSLE